MTIDLAIPDIATLHERRSEKWALYDRDVLCATVAEMDFPLAAPIADSLRAAIDRHDLGYSVPTPSDLYTAFTGFAQRRLRWSVDPEQVTLVPDVMVGLLELCRVITRPGDTVALVSPAYPPFFAELPHTGVRLTTIGLDGDGATDFDQLDAALRDGARVLVLANPHNPTGRALPRDELAAIAQRCAAAGAWVLADEIHAPITLGDAVHTPWLEVSDDARRCGVSLTSASKAFNLAALKTALIVTASPRAHDLVAQLAPMHDHAGLLGVVAGEVAFTQCDEWLDAVLAQLTANRGRLSAALADRLPEITWRPPDATYLAWLDCTAVGLGDDPAAAFLERGRVALSRGLNYGAQGAGHVRLNFATAPEHVDEMVARMAATVGR